jgi:hypothetical protein
MGSFATISFYAGGELRPALKDSNDMLLRLGHEK